MSLEAYQAERADFERLLAAVQRLRAATEHELRSVDWLAEIVRSVGLVPIPEAEQCYGPDTEYLNASQQGVIQIPREFARWLILTAEARPATYLEIGTFNGATATLATAFLQRFNPRFHLTTVDIFPAFLFHREISATLPLRYVVGETSFLFREDSFEAVFIDGDHSFEWAWADYQNVGEHARICGLHDVHNLPYRELPLGGVPAVWDLIRQSSPPGSCSEIVERPEAGVMGIGVRRV